MSRILTTIRRTYLKDSDSYSLRVNGELLKKRVRRIRTTSETSVLFRANGNDYKTFPAALAVILKEADFTQVDADRVPALYVSKLGLPSTKLLAKS